MPQPKFTAVAQRGIARQATCANDSGWVLDTASARPAVRRVAPAAARRRNVRNHERVAASSARPWSSVGLAACRFTFRPSPTQRREPGSQ